MSRGALVIPALACAAVLAGCSTGTKPLATPLGAPVQPPSKLGRGKIDDPRTTHVNCMLQAHIPVARVGKIYLQIGTPPSGPTVTFLPTAGAAQQMQISGQSQSSEVIGTSLLYPNDASEHELAQIETCLALGVTG
jgi:hypothetical protein